MNYIRKAVTALGGIFLAALLIAALAPRATRGIAAALVQVTNAPSNPVPTLDVESPGYSTIVSIGCQAQTSAGPLNYAIGCYLGSGNTTESTYAVPRGQRLVMQQFDANCSAPKGVTISEAVLLYSTPPTSFVTSNIVLPGNASGDVNYPLHYYADTGSNIQFAGFTSDSSGQTTCTVNVTGYLVNAPPEVVE